MFRKLVSKDHSEDDASIALEMLIEQNILNDGRFAESYIRYRIEKGFGPLKIRAELRERGVKRELIDLALGESDANWNKLVAKARSKRFGNEKPSDWNEKAKQTRFLQARGFTDEQIIKIVGD